MHRSGESVLPWISATGVGLLVLGPPLLLASPFSVREVRPALLPRGSLQQLVAMAQVAPCLATPSDPLPLPKAPGLHLTRAGQRTWTMPGEMLTPHANGARPLHTCAFHTLILSIGQRGPSWPVSWTSGTFAYARCLAAMVGCLCAAWDSGGTLPHPQGRRATSLLRAHRALQERPVRSLQIDHLGSEQWMQVHELLGRNARMVVVLDMKVVAGA